MKCVDLMLMKGAAPWKARRCQERLDRMEYLLENHSGGKLTDHLRWIGFIAHTVFWRVIFKVA